MSISVIKSRLRDSFFYIGASLVSFPVTILLSPIFAKKLSSTDFAQIGFFNNIVVFLTPIMTFSFYSYYMKGYSLRTDIENRAVLRTLFSFNLIAGLVISMISSAILFYYLKLSGSEFDFFPLGAIAVLTSLTAQGLGFYNIQLRFSRKSLQYFIINSLYIVLNLLLGLLLIYKFDLGALGRLLPILLLNLLCIIILLTKELKSFYIDLKIINSALKFSGPLILTNFIIFPITYIDRFLLESLHDVSQLGYYNIAVQIAGYFTVATSALLQVFEPDVFKAVNDNNNNKIFMSLMMFVGVVAFGGGIYILLSKNIVFFLTYGKYMEATAYVKEQTFLKMIEPVLYFLGFILIAKGKTKLVLFNFIIVAIISYFLNIILIDNYKYIGAIYAKILSNSIWLLLIGGELIYILKPKSKTI